MDSSRRSIYLTRTPWEQALKLFLQAFQDRFPLPGEKIPVEDSLGRIAASDVCAEISSPHYDAAAMDGAAVRSRETVGADLSRPKRLRLGDQAWWVDTGAPLPSDADAVIQIEVIHQPDDETIEIYSPVAPWHDVRKTGEDISQGACLVPANSRIGPYQIGVMLAGGVTAVSVRRKPRIGILPTGSDLVEPGTEVKPGDIIEYNSRMAAAMVSQWGGEARRHPSVVDEASVITGRLSSIVAESDATIVIAGSSAGRRDVTPQVMAQLGEVFVHGLNVMPGRPAVLGQIGGKPVIGLPGYPVSAAIIMDLFARPLVYAMLGTAPPEPSRIHARLTDRIFSKLGAEEFVRVTVGGHGEQRRAIPLPRGAGMLSSLARADGLVRIPADTEGLEAGAEVVVELLNSSGNDGSRTCVS